MRVSCRILLAPATNQPIYTVSTWCCGFRVQETSTENPNRGFCDTRNTAGRASGGKGAAGRGALGGEVHVAHVFVVVQQTLQQLPHLGEKVTESDMKTLQECAIDRRFDHFRRNGHRRSDVQFTLSRNVTSKDVLKIRPEELTAEELMGPGARLPVPPHSPPARARPPVALALSAPCTCRGVAASFDI